MANNIQIQMKYTLNYFKKALTLLTYRRSKMPTNKYTLKQSELELQIHRNNHQQSWTVGRKI